MNTPLYHLQTTSDVSDGEEIAVGFHDQKQNDVMITEEWDFPKMCPTQMVLLDTRQGRALRGSRSQTALFSYYYKSFILFGVSETPRSFR